MSSPLDPPISELGLIWASSRARIRVIVLKTLSINLMAVPSPILRAEWRASIRVSLGLQVWPQGDDPRVVEFLFFPYDLVLQHHPRIARGMVSHCVPDSRVWYQSGDPMFCAPPHP